jgi:hypothetical protein
MGQLFAVRDQMPNIYITGISVCQYILSDLISKHCLESHSALQQQNIPVNVLIVDTEIEYEVNQLLLNLGPVVGLIVSTRAEPDAHSINGLSIHTVWEK